MLRYFTARVEDRDGCAIHPWQPYATCQPQDDEDTFIPDVPEHKATPTGILTADGEMIMRVPRPIGFGQDGEW